MGAQDTGREETWGRTSNTSSTTNKNGYILSPIFFLVLPCSFTANQHKNNLDYSFFADIHFWKKEMLSCMVLCHFLCHLSCVFSWQNIVWRPDSLIHCEQYSDLTLKVMQCGSHQSQWAFDHINNVLGIACNDTCTFNCLPEWGWLATVIAIRNRGEEKCGSCRLVCSNNTAAYVIWAFIHKTWAVLKGFLKVGVWNQNVPKFPHNVFKLFSQWRKL